MPLDPTLIAFAASVLALAGFTKGVIGLGLPTISIGLLGLVMAPIEAAAVLVVPNLVTNVWQALAGTGWLGLARRFRSLAVGIVVGTFAGAPLLAAQGARWTLFALGACLILYAGLGLASRQWRVTPRREATVGGLTGFATGVAAIVTGVFVVPAVPFLQSLGLSKEEFVQALGLSLLASTIALAGLLAASGLFTVATAGASLAALLPALGGMALGQALRHRISQPAFRRCFFLGLILLGAYLVARSAM